MFVSLMLETGVKTTNFAFRRCYIDQNFMYVSENDTFVHSALGLFCRKTDRMYKVVLALSILVSLHCIAKGSAADSSTLPTRVETLDTIFQNYSKDALPPSAGNAPRSVELSINVREIFDISEMDSSFTARYYLILRWEDPRLKFQEYLDEDGKTKGRIRVPIDLAKEKGGCFVVAAACSSLQSWKLPNDLCLSWFHDCHFHTLFSAFIWDIFMTNEKSSNSFSLTDLSMFNSAFFVYSRGGVQFKRELLSNVRCPMELASFPHDTQQCGMHFRSFSFNNEAMNFTRGDISLGDIKIPSYQVEMGSDFTSFIDVGRKFNKTFPEFIVRIKLRRMLQYYMYQVSSRSEMGQCSKKTKTPLIKKAVTHQTVSGQNDCALPSEITNFCKELIRCVNAPYSFVFTCSCRRMCREGWL